MATVQIRISPLITLVPESFDELAIKHGFTPESLASHVLSDFVAHPPRAIQIASAAPLDTQDCADCELKTSCRSVIKRGLKNLICFEALGALLAIAAAVF